MTTRQRILGVVELFGEATAADLGDRLGLGPGKLYPALYRLESEGRLTGDWEPGPTPRTRRYTWPQETA